jgi:photosystem II stability/assembly factor-like uncharacterized protein
MSCKRYFSAVTLLAFVLVISACLCGIEASAQSIPRSFHFEKMYQSADAFDAKPNSNSAVQIAVRHDSAWFGGGKGLDLTTDKGFSWKHFGSLPPFSSQYLGNNDISAFAWNGPVMWASLAGDSLVNQEALPKGLGLVFSKDNGSSWTFVEQPQEQTNDSTFIIHYGNNSLKALAITTQFNNITYDIAVTKNTVWTASFAGGLRKSTDDGKTFSTIVLPPDVLDSITPTDTLHFAISPVDRPDRWNLDGTQQGLTGNLNHRVFSLLASDDSTIWVGTAAGINRSNDGGVSWRRFGFDNQLSPISGNFVVAIGTNTIKGVEYIWAATINATKPTEYRAVSFTTDRGKTWSTALRGEWTHHFGFKGEIVYAATNNGVFRSGDAGKSWIRFSEFIDPASRNRATQTSCYAVAAQGDTVWVANSDALMYTIDNTNEFFGTRWTIFRAAQTVPNTAEAYVYPNPFAPDDEVCRVHYKTDRTGKVTIKVFDFAMFPVRTIIQNASRFPEKEQDEIWDGKDNNGKQVANGLYYVQVTLGDGQEAWGKVIALQ